MTIGELLRLEVERRARWRKAILDKFEITGDPHDRLRRTEVLAELAHALKMRVSNNYFARKVILEVEALGAVAIKPHNKRFYRGIRRRPVGAIPAHG